MDKFERSEYEAQQAAMARHNVMDEDGFTLVTRAGAKGQNSDGVITITAAKAEDVKNLKPKKKELQDFYRFQMREAKRDSTSSSPTFSFFLANFFFHSFFAVHVLEPHKNLDDLTIELTSHCALPCSLLTLELVDLRRKFEEDKLRIEALKVNRRFKPY